MGAREFAEQGQGFNAYDNLQFYETPDALADRLVGMLGSYGRKDAILDAAAGRGALSAAWRRAHDCKWNRTRSNIHAVEVDGNHHAELKRHASIVGLDFMTFEGMWTYAVILMNPPFSRGASFVLRAWDSLWAGDIAAIINAETLRNPYTQERRRLAALIEQHGQVEYVQGAFQGEGVDREADVEVALVHLKKPASSGADWVGSTIESLQRDTSDGVEDSGIYRLPTEIALPATFVENQVMTFRAAVEAMRSSVRAEMVASHFAKRVGMTMEDRQNKGRGATEPYQGQTEEETREVLRNRYTDLKNRAWASVLRCTEMLQKMTRKVQRSAEAEFETIKLMEFTVPNVYGFLAGLIQSTGEMQTQALLEVFDTIIGYSSENIEVFRSYKSNDKHRIGMKVRHTRFIMTRMDGDSRGPSWDTQQRLADIDRVMGMLDQADTAGGLLDTCVARWRDLMSGERVDSAHFSIRAYGGTQTVHLFPIRRDLIRTLNLRVGYHRQWIPKPTETGTEAFMKAYDKADKLSKEMVEIASKSGMGPSRYRRNVIDAARLRWDRDEARLDGDVMRARDAINDAIEGVLRKHNFLDAIEQEEKAAQVANEGGGKESGAQLLLLGMG